jgi:hypothetical protein
MRLGFRPTFPQHALQAAARNTSEFLSDSRTFLSQCTMSRWETRSIGGFDGWLVAAQARFDLILCRESTFAETKVSVRKERDGISRLSPPSMPNLIFGTHRTGSTFRRAPITSSAPGSERPVIRGGRDHMNLGFMILYLPNQMLRLRALPFG